MSRDQLTARLLVAIDWAPTFLPALLLIAVMLTWPSRVLFEF